MFNKAIPLGLAGLAALTVAASIPSSWTASVKAMDGTQLSGTLRANLVGPDSAHANLELSGAKAGSELAWHVHRGACGTNAPVYGNAASYPTVKIGPDGRGHSEATIPAPTAGSYSVSVHPSAKDMMTIACGALVGDSSAAAPMPEHKDTTMKP